ncbi:MULTISPECIES: dTMP kinase [unclassified Bradyrhizobium]|uniref:dTMP kinase n=1 Tax=unclassified Bradyrhizobium TaxID=2631580 RepID=UPI002916DA65|nr:MULTISPECIES: dTMP kinase [unclassified Bradyrhizobium]
MKTRFRGRLITIVGFDGSGKTTQVDALERRFREAGRDVLSTRQPTDWYRNQELVQHFHDNGGSQQRARMLALLAAADRLHHVQQVIIPALTRGCVVICDRYVYATFGVFLHRGVEFELLVNINKGIPRPDFAFYLRLPPAALLARLRQRDGTNLKFEERSLDRVASIVGVYEQMGAHLIPVDGTNDAQAVSNDIWDKCGSGFRDE